MKTNEDIKDRIVTLHAQNMNGRETPDEAFAKGVEACLEELNELDCKHPYAFVQGDGEMSPAQCLKCGEYL